MCWTIYSQQFQNFFVFKFPEAPYFLVLIGFLVSLACGLPLTTVLQKNMQYRATKFYWQTEYKWEKLQLLVSLLGSIVGFSIVLASTLEILGSPTLPSYLLSVIITNALVSWVLPQKNRKFQRRVSGSY
jgi:uncharacterized BrkB/YihY/UPF0761 family membrane protein